VVGGWWSGARDWNGLSAKAGGPFLLGEIGGDGVTVRNLILTVAVALSGVGCERRAARVALPNLVIPVACASEITLVRCDARVNPPRCKSARVTYRSGCEEIVVGK
jgi:hypothetical protein